MSVSTIPARRSIFTRGSKTSNSRLSEEAWAEKAKKLVQFLQRSSRISQANARCSRFESNTLRPLDMWCPPRTPGLNDNADVSLHPSYNIVITDCADRYRETKEKYHKQFQREMEHLIESKSNIREQYDLKRILCYKTSWPPLHTKRELNNFVTKFFQLTPRQRKRVNYLMETDLN